MRTEHKRHIITNGLNPNEIAEVLYNLVMRYGDKILDLVVDCNGIYFTTIEYIK